MPTITEALRAYVYSDLGETYLTPALRGIEDFFANAQSRVDDLFDTIVAG